MVFGLWSLVFDLGTLVFGLGSPDYNALLAAGQLQRPKTKDQSPKSVFIATTKLPILPAPQWRQSSTPGSRVVNRDPLR